MKTPKIVLMQYPALNMDFDQFSPSLLYSFDEYLLNFAMLLLVKKCLLDINDDATKNFMLSPVYCPDEILKKFPKSYILISEKDPLHDGGM